MQWKYEYKYTYIFHSFACPSDACHDDVFKWEHFRVTGPLWGESTDHWWISLTKTNDVEFSLIYAWINGWANNREGDESICVILNMKNDVTTHVMHKKSIVKSKKWLWYDRSEWNTYVLMSAKPYLKNACQIRKSAVYCIVSVLALRYGFLCVSYNVLVKHQAKELRWCPIVKSMSKTLHAALLISNMEQMRICEGRFVGSGAKLHVSGYVHPQGIDKYILMVNCPMTR